MGKKESPGLRLDLVQTQIVLKKKPDQSTSSNYWSLIIDVCKKTEY